MITEFLLARIAEDEAGNGCNGEGEYWTCELRSERIEAECEAKRRIVTLAQGMIEEAAEQDRRANLSIYEETGATQRTDALTLLKILATVYADHPDYREEWA
jgi:hypothetical protein